MDPFPNKYIYVVTFLSIVLYMAIDFHFKGDREFPQLNFNWNKASTVRDYGTCEIVSLSHNTLVFKYKKSLTKIDNNNTLKIKTSKGKVYYFRYEYKIVQKGTLQLKGGVWVTKIPGKGAETFVFASEIITPMLKNGDMDVCFIGYSDNKWGGFRSLRKDLKSQNRSINFVGTRQDVYGYAYVPFYPSKGKDDLKDLLANLPKARIYLLFFETIEANKDLLVYSSLVKGLSKKGQHIYINIWPEIKGNQKNENIKKINLLSQKIAEKNDQVEIIDLNGHTENLATLLDNGQYFLNNSGYSLYQKEILEHIEDDEE